MVEIPESVNQIMEDRKQIWVEVGAGHKKGSNGWITLDMNNGCDINWDLRNGLPFPDNTVQRIYSSHFLEHLSFREAEVFLAECMRAMAPGGEFSICVPNARLYIDAYINGDELKAPFLSHKPSYFGTTKIDYVNYMAYMNGHHKYMFDEENLIHILQNNGFKKCMLRGFDPDVDMKKRDFESIYAVCHKPY